LHNSINQELSELFDDTSAPHDGDEYHFHMTIELGKVKENNPYRAYFDSLLDTKTDRSFLAEYIALFYYSGRDQLNYMNYKVLPLEG